jgi:hypothetical protein
MQQQQARWLPGIQQLGPHRPPTPRRQPTHPSYLARLVDILHRLELGLDVSPDELNQWEDLGPERQASVIQWVRHAEQEDEHRAEQERRMRVEVAIFGDPARAFYGLPQSGTVRPVRARSSLRSTRRPTCTRRRSSTHSSASSGGGDPDLSDDPEPASRGTAARLTYAVLTALQRGKVVA